MNWSHVSGIPSAYEKTPKKSNSGPQFLQNTELLLECVFVSLPGEMD